ncbi:hypothetical protein [Rufibacter tibetensis]|uniref:Outer membrane protein beta-barrel domain-containing protein n=1 Tax=Rufibacter tibetensis TaxID=512763 RepID=A0A0P0CX11_9BACT|nr:hypothetical protein [Rufibacter tibetensis]ALI98925.1 hypothetical protein DC20_07960 [Rufibacter tibetensis]
MKKLFTILILLTITYQIALCQPSPLSVQQFIDKKIEVVDIKSDFNIMTINGFDDKGNPITEKVEFKQGEVLAILKLLSMPRIAILTVPIKVRPSINELPQTATTGLSNAGVGVNLLNARLERYFINGKKSTHIISLGVFVAPSAEELTPENTNGHVTSKYKQLFISPGLSITYSYNDIAFSFIPVGFDYATGSEGKKWVYNKERWWGFGIGVSTKVLGLL